MCVDNIWYLVEFIQYVFQYLQVVNFNGYVDGCQLLFGVVMVGNVKYVYFFVGENGCDIM